MQKPCLPPNCGGCAYSWRRPPGSRVRCLQQVVCSCHVTAGLLPVAMVIEMFEEHASKTSSFRLGADH